MTGPHERWDELAAGYALDALEPAEEAELMAHLDGCDICNAALHDHEFVAAQLGALADDSQITPPAWSSIRAGIVGGDDIVVLADHRQSRARSPWVLGAVAAAFVIVTAVSVVIAVRGGPSATTTAISACRSDSLCHVIDLNRGSHQRAVALVRGTNVELLPTHLSALGNGRVYALWQLPRDGKPTLLSQPVPTGRNMNVSLALPYDETAGFALSVEPAGPPATTPTTVVALGGATT